MNQSKSGQEVAKKSALEKRSSFSKNDLRFWESRVYLPAYSKGGEAKEAGTYAVRIQAHGERRNVSVGKTSKREAAKAALALYNLIKAHGWERGLEEFRGEAPPERSGLTLGDYLGEVTATGLFTPRTLRTYSSKVRRIASDIAKVRLSDDPDTDRKLKADYVGGEESPYEGGGAAEWKRRVDRVPLDKLAPEKVAKWRSEYLAQYRSNPAKLKSATRTVNSCIRAGKAIFKAEVREHLSHLKLPSPLPFVGMKTSKESPNRYRSEVENPEVLLVAGMRELAEATRESTWAVIYHADGGEGEPPPPGIQDTFRADMKVERRQEAFKVLVLGLAAGLRRGEIDRLQWSQVDLKNGEIRIETTDCFAPKADSAGDIPLDPEIVELLKEWKRKSTDRFVVAGVEPITDTDSYHYRAKRAHRELVEWLHSKGISARNPIHTLRKEYGSIVCEKAGVHVASRLLRHANLTTTAAVYTDDRGRVTSGLGGFMSDKRSNSAP